MWLYSCYWTQGSYHKLKNQSIFCLLILLLLSFLLLLLLAVVAVVVLVSVLALVAEIVLILYLIEWFYLTREIGSRILRTNIHCLLLFTCCYFALFLVSFSRFKLNHSIRNSIIVIFVFLFRLKQNEDHDDRKDQNDRNTILIAFIFLSAKQKEKRVARAWLYWLALKNTVFVLRSTVFFRWSFVIRKSRIHS